MKDIALIINPVKGVVPELVQYIMETKILLLPSKVHYKCSKGPISPQRWERVAIKIEAMTQLYQIKGRGRAHT